MKVHSGTSLTNTQTDNSRGSMKIQEGVPKSSVWSVQWLAVTAYYLKWCVPLCLTIWNLIQFQTYRKVARTIGKKVAHHSLARLTNCLHFPHFSATLPCSIHVPLYTYLYMYTSSVCFLSSGHSLSQWVSVIIIIRKFNEDIILFSIL